MQAVGTASTSTRRRRAPLYALFLANAVSSIGDVLAFVAVPWFVLQTTGSVEKTGITAAFTTAGVAISAFFGASLVDRLGFRLSSVMSDLVAGASIAAIPLLYLLSVLEFRELLVFVFLAGFFATPGATARSALVPDLAEPAGMRLERAAAVTDGVQRLSVLIGGPLAGLLIVLVGTSNLLWIDGATFLFSALLIGLLVPRQARKSQGKPTSAEGAPRKRGPIRRLGQSVVNLTEGVRFIWRDGVLFGLISVIMVTNMLDAGGTDVLTPAFVRQLFNDPVVLGLLLALFGAGAVVGTIFFGVLGHRLPRRWTLGVSYTLGGGTRFFALALFPFYPVVNLLYAVQGVAGAFLGQINPLIGTVRYERVPSELRARVFGTSTAGVMLGAPLGALISGLAGSWFGVQETLLAFGAIYLVATLSLLVNPAMKDLARKRTPDDNRTDDREDDREDGREPATAAASTGA